MAVFSSLSSATVADTIVPTVVAVTGGVVAYLVLTSVFRKVVSHGNPNTINKSIKKDTAKVVDCADIEDLPDKVSYCRCWRSKKFPLCDGSHNAHNMLTGDNVGPLCLKKRNPAN